jgi:GH25 family lysozyme M1 (1,4-beta-N-acetylmuramidase)
MKLKGIDVSHHQGKIDWEKVKASGIDFAIVRVGYSNRNGNGGLNFDKRYTYNIQQCNRLGIPVGVYIYCYDRNAYAASITARAFVKAIKKFRIEYPVIYDIEYDNKDLSKGINTAICNAAMREIESAGYYGMIYASRDFFLNHLDMSQLKTTDKWEAAYRKVDDELVENGIWQYSSTGSVPGIVGNVDMNYSYKDYAAIIKNAGLNGFVKERETPIEATVVKPTPVTGLVTEEVKQTSTIKKTVTANKLNVRSGASMDSPVVRIIVKGDKVSVEDEKDGWSKIGKNEWVSTKFLK